MRAMPRHALAVALAAAALAGCGGDDDDAPSSSPAPTSEAAPPAPATTQREDPPAPRREERTLEDCLRAAPGVEEVLRKGADSEDARYFEDLTGERPRVLAITLEGEPAEIDIFVFATEAAARKAAPGAGGAGLEAAVRGSAVLVAPASARTAGIERCLAP